MKVIDKCVVPTPINIPLLFYKNHSQDFIDQLPMEAINHEMFQLRARIVIDRIWAQRLLEAWSVTKSREYVLDVFGGYNQIDAFVLIRLTDLKRVLLETIDAIVDKKSKSTLDGFLSDVERYLEENNEYLMINGQHRDDVLTRLWDSEYELPYIFKGMNDGMFWNDLDFQTQMEGLQSVTHPVVIYDRIESLDDIEKIIIRHNEGDEWNPHEKRSIKASYLMSELRRLDDYEPAQKLFDMLGTKGTQYSRQKKGISFLASQLYYQYIHKEMWFKIQLINSKALDDMVEWDDTTWSKTSVDNFTKFFRKVIRELSHYFVGLPKNSSTNIRHKIATLRNYFMFRNIMAGKTNFQPNVYTINNERNFVAWYVSKESDRLLLRNQLTPTGQKLYDGQVGASPTSKIREDREKALWNDHRLANAYRYLMNGSSVDGQRKVADKMWVDFDDDYENGLLNHAVSLRGKDVSNSVKEEVRRLAVANLNGNFTLDDIFAISDKDTTDIGHDKVPQSKGGSNHISNLKVQDRTENRSQQDNH